MRNKTQPVTKQDLTQKQRTALFISKIKPQFAQCPEGVLMLAVIEQATRDLTNTALHITDRRSAYEYLSHSEFPHAEKAGVSSEWVSDMIERYGVLRNLYQQEL